MTTNENNDDADETSGYQSAKEGDKSTSNQSQNSFNISASENEELFFDTLDSPMDGSEKNQEDTDKKWMTIILLHNQATHLSILQ